jgi:UDP-3-O-[3-hydroxymyristoyl] glucosamine N-acyltransferase
MGASVQQHDLASLAARFDLQLRGDGETIIDGVGTLSGAGGSQLAFLSNPRYTGQLADTRAGAVVLAAEFADQCPVPALIAADPYVAYAKMAMLFQPRPASDAGVHASAVVAAGAEINPSAHVGPLCVIEEGARIGAGAILGPHCVVGPRCRIGAQSHLMANVTLVADVTLGERVLIHSGAVIGADGFGLAVDGDHWIKVPQLGGVRIGDDCEIGANTCIDGGAIEDTVLEQDVRLDNQIQIGHNVHIGAHTAIAGATAIGGSAHIGRWCMIAGNVGIAGHLEVADKVVVTAKSLVSRSIHEAGEYSSGTPLQNNRAWRKNAARFRHLDDMARRLKALERKNHD